MILPKKKHINWTPYIYIGPPFLLLILMFFYPIMYNIILTFYHVKPIGGGGNFVGFDNYQVMLTNPLFWHSFKISGIYTLASVFGAIFMGLITALIINMRFKGRLLVRGITVLPWAVPYVVTCIVWTRIYDYQFGIADYVLQRIHVIKGGLNWLISPELALLAVLIPTVWKLYPLATIMLLAGLQSIPKERYEAAEIDGAGVIQKLTYITFPGLAPIGSILILLLTVWSFGRALVVIFLLTQGGPSRSTETLVLRIYLQAFKYFKTSQAATTGVAILLVSMIFSLVYLNFTKKITEV